MLVDEDREGCIILGLMGDVMLGRLVDEETDGKPASYVWGDVLPILKKTDLNFLNLETTLTTSEKKVSKVFNFKAHPSKVSALKNAQIDGVTVANNHILDYSIEGMLETLEVLDIAGIQHTGAGTTLNEAKNSVIFEKKGVKVGFIGYTDNEPDWIAAEKRPGTNYIRVGDIDMLREDIKVLRQQVDILVISLHWGPNMREAPPRHYREFAHAIIDAGADILHGHSAHIFQGVEVYNEKLILYDTGDFVDDYMVDPFLRNDLSFLFLVKLTKSGLKDLQLIPTKIGRCQVNLAKGSDRQWSMDRMIALSKEFGLFFLPNEEGLSLF